MKYQKKTKPALWMSLQPVKRKPSKPSRAAYNRRVKEWLVGKSCAACGERAAQCHHKHGRGYNNSLLLV